MRFCSSLPAVAVLALSVAVHAETFDLTFGSASSLFSGSGVLTTGTMVAPLEYTITSMTGVVSMGSGGTSTIESLLAPGVFPTPTNGGSFPANDNMLFVQDGVGSLTENGVSFLLGNGTEMNLYEAGSGPGEFVFESNGVAYSENAPITIKAVPTPEPSSFLLLGSGLIVVAGAARRRLQR